MSLIKLQSPKIPHDIRSFFGWAERKVNVSDVEAFQEEKQYMCPVEPIVFGFHMKSNICVEVSLYLTTSDPSALQGPSQK